jgi:hypothetical protein
MARKPMLPPAGKPAKKLHPGSVLQAVTSRKSFALALAGTVADHLFNRRRRELEAMDAGFDHLDPYELGRGAARIMALWMSERHPEHTARQHAATLDRALKKLDADASTLERAMARFLASKIMLNLEGYRSQTLSKDTARQQAYYEVYQNYVREILRVFPQYRQLYRQDIFLGKPFSAESLLIFSQRMLSALVPHAAEPDFNAFLFRIRGQLANRIDSNKADVVDYLAQLIVLTRPEDAPAYLGEAMDAWFEHYQSFRLNKLNRQEKLLYAGFALVGGDWTRQLGGKLWNGIFSRKS